MLKTALEMEVKTQEDNKDLLETAVEFNKADLKYLKIMRKRKLFDQIKENEEPNDPEIKDLFIDDNNLFENDDITDEDKKFIWTLLTELILLQIETFLIALKIQK